MKSRMIKRNALSCLWVYGSCRIEFSIITVIARKSEIVEGIVAVMGNRLNMVNGKGIE